MELNRNLQDAGANLLNAKAFETYVGIVVSVVCIGIFVVGMVYLCFGPLQTTMHIFNM